MRGYSTCYGHRPDLAEARRRAARKGGRAGGRGRPGRSLEHIDRTLVGMIGGVLTDDAARKVDRGDAAVVIQACNARIRLVEVGRKIAEQDELLARIEALEDANGVGAGRRWG